MISSYDCIPLLFYRLATNLLVQLLCSAAMLLQQVDKQLEYLGDVHVERVDDLPASYRLQVLEGDHVFYQAQENHQHQLCLCGLQHHTNINTDTKLKLLGYKVA